MSSIGMDLKLRRVMRGITQYRLAAKLSIPAPHLSEIEREKRRVSPEMKRRIEEAIDELATKGGGR